MNKTNFCSNVEFILLAKLIELPDSPNTYLDRLIQTQNNVSKFIRSFNDYCKDKITNEWVEVLLYCEYIIGASKSKPKWL